jgi:hypothetical protein
MEILGLPLVEWIVIPIYGVAFGALFYGALDRYPVFRTWLSGTIFFLIRFFLEAGNEIGRPDRILAVLVLWTVGMIAVALGRKAMRNRYDPR